MPPEFVQFPVPEDRVADVAMFLYGGAQATLEALPEAKSELGVERRNELLTRVYVESQPTFRRLLLLLAERPNPEDLMSYRDVGLAMGWKEPRSLPGALGAFGRRAKHRYGGFWPFDRTWDDDEWTHSLRMDPAIAAFLLDLHDERQMPED
jgi:hypothetical protein